MTQFKAGDKFIPRKPKQNNDSIAWFSGMEMDKHDGKILTVMGINADGLIISEEAAWLFHPDWCEKVEEIPNNQESNEHLKTFYYRVEGMDNECKAILTTTSEITGHITTLEQALKAQELPNNQEHIVEANKMIDWEQRRYELAKAAMQSLLANPSIVKDYVTDSSIQWIDNYSIIFADEMIKQLKRE